MKITKFAIFFVLIIIPFLIVNDYNVKRMAATTHAQERYEKVIDSAKNDATFTLLNTAGVDISSNQIEIQPELAIDSFFKTMELNFGISNDYDKIKLKFYVPVILVIDNDGVYSYSIEEFTNSQGKIEMKHMLHEKRYFTYVDTNGFIINFNINDYYTVQDLVRGISFKGTFNELKSINIAPYFIRPAEEAQIIKRESMLSIIENELDTYINRHNKYAKEFGLNYEFFIPRVDDSTWNNTIDDVGIVAVIQGMPAGDRKLNVFSLGASGIYKKNGLSIEGYDNGGKLVYHRKDCTSKIGTYEKSFSNGKDAALDGYSPCPICY